MDASSVFDGDIKTVYDSMTSGLGYCLQLSSGSHAVSGVFNITRENIIIAGVTASLFAPTTLININISTNNTRIKMKELTSLVLLLAEVLDILSNVEFQGKISYPSAVSNAGWLYFFECE